ncbi:hypothetical protein [Bradyrhizobium liaoningense]|uniref:hypothetical protein n=1 Tax=Bradyrhizobium liaoningense TaxID=43992 RepID=UPI001BA80C45|nr:hypothetical protein [Bradyrhizobium liaoningense]MBR0856758.1 hypothetical protein [Bradyrhizobium liaoningense]
MTLALTILAAIWVCGLLLIAGLYLNDLRVVFNSVAPGAQISMLPARPRWMHETPAIVSLASFELLLLTVVSLTIGRVLKLDRAASVRISQCDPACLTDAGRLHLANAARHERFALAWSIAGIASIIMICSFS